MRMRESALLPMKLEVAPTKASQICSFFIMLIFSIDVRGLKSTKSSVDCVFVKNLLIWVLKELYEKKKFIILEQIALTNSGTAFMIKKLYMRAKFQNSMMLMMKYDMLKMLRKAKEVLMMELTLVTQGSISCNI